MEEFSILYGKIDFKMFEEIIIFVFFMFIFIELILVKCMIYFVLLR